MRRNVAATPPIAGELSTIPAIRDVGPETAARLVARHGTEATALVALGAELDLLRPLIPGRVFLEAEVAWAARHELAFSLDDVLARRTRVAQELPDRGAAIAARVLGATSRAAGPTARRGVNDDGLTVRPRRKSGIGKRGGSAYLTAVNATDEVRGQT